MEIMDDVVESFAWKLLGSLVPIGTDSEALQGCLLKFREESKKLRTRIEI